MSFIYILLFNTLPLLYPNFDKIAIFQHKIKLLVYRSQLALSHQIMGSEIYNGARNLKMSIIGETFEEETWGDSLARGQLNRLPERFTWREWE